MDQEIKKPSILYRILTHTILLVILAQFDGGIMSHDGWFFEYNKWYMVAWLNAVASWPSWLIAYLFSRIFMKAYYPIRLVCLSFAFLILDYLLNLPLPPV